MARKCGKGWTGTKPPGCTRGGKSTKAKPTSKRANLEALKDKISAERRAGQSVKRDLDRGMLSFTIKRSEKTLANPQAPEIEKRVTAARLKAARGIQKSLDRKRERQARLAQRARQARLAQLRTKAKSLDPIELIVEIEDAGKDGQDLKSVYQAEFERRKQAYRKRKRG